MIDVDPTQSAVDMTWFLPPENSSVRSLVARFFRSNHIAKIFPGSQRIMKAAFGVLRVLAALFFLVFPTQALMIRRKTFTGREEEVGYVRSSAAQMIHCSSAGRRIILSLGARIVRRNNW